MKKRAYTRWITSFSFLLFMMYGCSSEDEYPIEVKTVAALTKQLAQTYYQEVYGYPPRLKNAEENRISLTPQWDLAELYSDSLWYAVESPIKFENDLIVTLISSDVIENIRSENIGNIKQVLRLVILRNKETGKTVSFIMAILPSLNYMKQKDEAIYGNKYLKRTSNLDGSVLFFGIDGQFVNGWIYENGKITAGTITQNSKLRNTKKMATYCWEQVTTTADGTEVGRVIYCEESGAGGGVDMSDRGSGLMNGLSNGGIDNDYKDPSHGGDKDINNSNQKKDKKPEKRTDCTESAKKQADAANKAMNLKNNGIKDKINSLRSMAKTSIKDEYSTSIRIIDSKTAYADVIKKGKWNYTTTDFAQSTLYALHTHNERGGYTGPSVSDIYTLLQANSSLYDKYGNGGYNFYGGIIFAFDESEYLIYFEDRREAQKFYKNKGKLFMPDALGNTFLDTTIKLEFTTIMNNLLKNGYSEENSYNYAMIYMLDTYSTNVKIAKKDKGNTEFKEIKTEKVNNNYQPKICP